MSLGGTWHRSIALGFRVEQQEEIGYRKTKPMAAARKKTYDTGWPFGGVRPKKGARTSFGETTKESNCAEKTYTE